MDDKLEAFKNAKSPATVGEVQSLLGLRTYSSRYITNHASIFEPLKKLIRNDIKWLWTNVLYDFTRPHKEDKQKLKII